MLELSAENSAATGETAGRRHCIYNADYNLP
ncbi:hypothetical protein COL8621_02770 [Actibacterium lipolyticum]|uniref:Uncharacterized protein n=1 Tax=Actibacterium lipolyticum TaxID=1524263 RepID=A0A238KR68_9RHOB|nr:hypothetical protein COL8621_02770 [Actibacterium lipolyticum]